jgi:hypothetical protein
MTDSADGATPRARLSAVRLALLHLHKALLDRERASYETVHGRVNAGEMLRLALQDPQFAWLRSLSELIVRIDESIDADEGTDGAESLLASVRALLTPSNGATAFARAYEDALQRDPDIVVGHSRVMQALLG